ncbi:hypothetical protein A8C56_13760 [Niabella ginsenosidivorans]|uniref:DUF4142 domain-containing protein n=1 Tax=Niabella ginsenosidivorans TaxID=1176587 RepID=A0A1A9I2L2_9BACT|nr:DUF4142 domain-containing protein [Niabella ginsenosidivorans]ANH81898.1 hypothetical protein A8C56_13760 [Niabella ginsenosidivorans]
MKQRCLNFIIGLPLLAGTLMPACNTASDNRRTIGAANETLFDKSDTANPSMRILEKDADFAMTAINGGIMEIQLGQLAQNNARAQSVRDFGLRMIRDHSGANNEILTLARQKNISLTTALGDDKKKKYNELRSLEGERFDKKYMSWMVTDHMKGINEFRQYVSGGADQDLVQWALAKLPVWELHLRYARQVDSLLRK